jgi:hypothetical protein
VTWHFLQEQAEACWPENSWAGAPFALLSQMPTADASCSPVNAMASCPASPSGTTSAPLTANPGEDTSISSAEASPVKTSPWQASMQGFLALAQAYGQSSPVLLARYDPATHSLRTFQLLLLEDSTECLQTLPRWGWMSAGAVSGLMMSARPISANASGSWPTPTRNANADCPSERQRHTPALASAVQMWPTPQAFDAKDFQYSPEALKRAKDGYANLREEVLRWPTPNSRDFKGAPGPGWTGQASLPRAVQLATPSARDWKSGKASQATHDKNSRPLSEQIGGSLNPTWVEWLMNWPLDWTDGGPLNPQMFRVWLQVSRTAWTVCEPSVTDGCPSVPPQPGGY